MIGLDGAPGNGQRWGPYDSYGSGGMDVDDDDDEEDDSDDE
jgi:hypothetical protein